MNGIRRALLLATGERYFTLAANFLTVAAVSRLLRPDEIGVSVIGLAIVAFFVAFREFASPNFLIQHRQLTLAEIRKAFAVMLLLTATITTALSVSAPWLADLYGDERLTAYLRVVSPAVLLDIVSALVSSLLRREMAFGKVALISASSAAATMSVTIGLALLGYSYMSFAWASLASATVGGCIALILCQDRRIFLPLIGDWRGMLVFGGYNGTNILLHRVYETLPYLVLGRILSLDAVAYFNRGLMLCQLPDKVFLLGAASVILPAFSGHVRDGRSLKGPYLRAVSLITAIQWPALAVLALLADPIVGILFGAQWSAIVPLVRIIAIASMFSFSFELNYPVFLSVGAVRDSFLRALIIWPVSALILTVSAFIGLKAAACSFLIAVPFQAFVSLQFVRRHIGIEWPEIAAAVSKSFVVVGTTVVGPLVVMMLSGFRMDLSIPQGLAAMVFAGFGWLAGLLLTRHDLMGEIQNVAAHLGTKGYSALRTGRALAAQKG